MQDEQLITADAAYRLLGLTSTKRLYEAAARGQVPVVRIGRRVRFSRQQLERFIAQGGTRPTEART
jgi:excisionase family DNA binding protein